VAAQRKQRPRPTRTTVLYGLLLQDGRGSLANLSKQAAGANCSGVQYYYAGALLEAKSVSRDVKRASNGIERR
jgi:hypothetical protein